MKTLMEPLTLEVEGNAEFAKWLEQWTEGIQQSRDWAEQIHSKRGPLPTGQDILPTMTRDFRIANEVCDPKSGESGEVPPAQPVGESDLWILGVARRVHFYSATDKIITAKNPCHRG